MPDTPDPRPTRLEGFDANGVLVGTAEWAPPRWNWRMTGKDRRRFVATKPEARALLREWGAVNIREK